MFTHSEYNKKNKVKFQPSIHCVSPNGIKTTIKIKPKLDVYSQKVSIAWTENLQVAKIQEFI